MRTRWCRDNYTEEKGRYHLKSGSKLIVSHADERARRDEQLKWTRPGAPRGVQAGPAENVRGEKYRVENERRARGQPGRRVWCPGPSEQGVSNAGMYGAAEGGTALGVVVRTGGRARADALAQARVRARGMRVVLVEPRALG